MVVCVANCLPNPAVLDHAFPSFHTHPMLTCVYPSAHEYQASTSAGLESTISCCKPASGPCFDTVLTCGLVAKKWLRFRFFSAFLVGSSCPRSYWTEALGLT